MVGDIYIYLTIYHSIIAILRGGEETKTWWVRGVGWGDVDQPTTKSLILGFEHLYLPSRLRNATT